jgi:hypothetical protein
MKTKRLIALAIGATGLATLALTSGCIVAGPPGPGPAVITVYPDYYVWDGYEYVGVIGGEYYYLGPDDDWIVCDPVRVRRFNVWVTAHPDWRAHATINEHYRADDHGRFHSMRPPPAREDRGRGRDRDDER